MNYLIEDAFTITNVGTVLCFRVEGLTVISDNKGAAYEEVANFVSIGDLATIGDNEEEFYVQKVERFGKLMDPILYDKKIGILIGETPKKSSYIGQSLKITKMK